MMKVTTDDDFTALRAVTSAIKKKIDCFAVLTPSLVEDIQSRNMTPSSIFIKIVEQIKVSIPVPTATTTSTGETSTTAPATAVATTTVTPAPETEDEILVRLGTIYTPILCFLWVSDKITDVITPPPLLAHYRMKIRLNGNRRIDRKSFLPPLVWILVAYPHPHSHTMER